MISDMDKGGSEERAADARAVIGHVHLRVADLDRAIAFYRVLGFATVQQFGSGIAFLSNGGSHPQIGLHNGEGHHPAAPAAPCTFAILVADREALAIASQRLMAAGVTIVDAIDHGVSEAVYVRDPDGNRVEVYYDRPAEEWPRDASGGVTLTAHSIDVDALKAVESSAAASAAPPQPAGMSDTTRGRLRDMRVRLLNLHKALLEDAKVAYEMDRGRIGSTANLLQLVINDPWFAWLHPLSELVVRIDETLQTDALATDADGTVLLEQVGRLLSPAQSAEAFAQRYYDALQRQPAVIVAHAEVRRLLKEAK